MNTQNIYEISRAVASRHSYCYIKEIEPGRFLSKPDTGRYELSEAEEAAGVKVNNRGWILFDMTTANAVKTVYEAVSERNQALLLSFPLKKPSTLFGNCFPNT